MAKPSHSKYRDFQKRAYISRCMENGNTPDPSTLEMFDDEIKARVSRWDDPSSKVDNLEWDLLTTDWILEKARNSEVYAQNLYAAMCNNDFQKLEVWNVLKDIAWGCSWRHAGGVIADMRQEGDYIDWYCSGIRNDADELTEEEWNALTPEQQDRIIKRRDYVSEGVVTDEIREDLRRLGWMVLDR